MMLSKAFPFMMLIGMAMRAVAEDSITIEDLGDDSVNGLFNEEQDYNDDPPEAIIGGVDLTHAERKKRPYLVNVGGVDPVTGLDRFFCGGSLISSSAVLTAAHCLYDEVGNWKPPQFVDFYRLSKLDTSGFLRIPITSASAVPHNNYNFNTRDNDVAILFLNTQMSIKPVILNTDQNVPGSTGVRLDVAGWGAIDNDENQGDVLKATTIHYVTTFDCTRPPYNWAENEVTDSMMCAIGDGTTAHCRGDSGE